MSVKWMTHVWQLEDLSPSHKIVLLKLADNANDEGGRCYPSIPYVAKQCALSVRTVQTVIAELEEWGHLSRDMVPGRVTHYTLHGPGTPEFPALVQKLRGRKSRTTPPAASAPPPPQSAAIPHTPYIAEPSVEPLGVGDLARGADPDAKPAPVHIHDVVLRCCAEAGCREDMRGTDNMLVVDWLNKYDLEALILPTIRRTRDALVASGQDPPHSLRYFTRPLRNAANAQTRLAQEIDLAADRDHSTVRPTNRFDAAATTNTSAFARVAQRHARERTQNGKDRAADTTGAGAGDA